MGKTLYNAINHLKCITSAYAVSNFSTVYVALLTTNPTASTDKMTGAEEVDDYGTSSGRKGIGLGGVVPWNAITSTGDNAVITNNGAIEWAGWSGTNGAKIVGVALCSHSTAAVTDCALYWSTIMSRTINTGETAMFEDASIIVTEAGA